MSGSASPTGPVPPPDRLREGAGDPLLPVLEETLGAVLEDRGRAVFVVAPPDPETGRRLATFQEEAFRRHRELRVGFVDCVHTTPEDDAWEQFDILLLRRHRLRDAARRLAPEWMEALPLGEAVKAVYLTVRSLITRKGPEEEPDEPAPSGGGGVDYAQGLWTLGPLEPRLLILENFQQAEPSELAGTARLVAHLERTRALLVVVARTKGQLPPSVEDLILEAERGGRSRRVDLTAGGADELERLSEGDRRLLARAAVEGEVLHPVFLEVLLDVPELELEDRFASLVRAGVLQSRGVEEVDGEPSGAYAFRLAGGREACLAALDPAEKAALEARAARLRG